LVRIARSTTYLWSLPSDSPCWEVVPRLPQSAVPVEPPDVAGRFSDCGNRVRTHTSACGDAHKAKTDGDLPMRTSLLRRTPLRPGPFSPRRRHAGGSGATEHHQRARAT